MDLDRRLPNSDLETDCAEETSDTKMPSSLNRSKAPQSGSLLTPRSSEWMTQTGDLDAVDSCDSGFMSGYIPSVNRDSGLELSSQMEDLEITEGPSRRSSARSFRDSGFLGQVDIGMSGDSASYGPDTFTFLKAESQPVACSEPSEPKVVESEADACIPQLFAQDEDNDSELHLTIIHQLPMSAKIIELAPSADFLNLKNNLRQTALHLAVLTNQPHIVRLLVVYGADLEVRNRDGNTPLHLACMHGFEGCIEQLTTPMQRHEISAVSHALPLRRIPQDLLIKNYEGETCLHITLRAPPANKLRILCYLIQKCGADVNCTEGKSGRALLHDAADRDDASLASFLLRLPSIQVNCRTYAGHTPLQLARCRGHRVMAQKLVDHGAEEYDLSDDSMSESDDDSIEDMCYDDLQIRGRPVST